MELMIVFCAALLAALCFAAAQLVRLKRDLRRTWTTVLRNDRRLEELEKADALRGKEQNYLEALVNAMKKELDEEKGARDERIQAEKQSALYIQGLNNILGYGGDLVTKEDGNG